jgi:hypothetical protein
MTQYKNRPGRVGQRLALVCWFGTVCVSVQALGPEAIPWRTDFHRAEVEARSRDRLLWVQFTGSWCANCVRMERESFVHPQVVEHARSFFVPVKVQSEQHEDLVAHFGLSGIPATILVKPSGEVVGRQEGFLDAAAFRGFLERALIQSGHSLSPVRSEVTPASATASPATKPKPPANPSTAIPVKHRLPASETARR